MLWPTLAWSTGLAGGIGSAFAINSLPWRYAPPMGASLVGLWLNNTSSGLLRLAGEGASWGGGGSFAGLVAYDLWKQYQQWFGEEIAPQLEPPAPEAPPSEPTQPEPPEAAPSEKPAEDTTEGGIFFTPPRVSQGHYPTRDRWWRNP